MKKKYQKPQCEIIKMQSEGVLCASGKINQGTTPSTPGVSTKNNFFNLK